MIREQKKIIENNLANKQDIAKINIKIAEINQKTELIQKEQIEIKKELTDFKHKTDTQIAEIKKETVLIRKEIDLMGQKIVNKMYIGIFSCLGAFITIMKLLELFQN